MRSSSYDWDHLIRYLNQVHGYPIAVLHVCTRSDLSGLYKLVPHKTGDASTARHSFDSTRDRRQALAFVSARTTSTTAELEDMSLGDLEDKIRDAIDFELGRLPCDHPKARCHRISGVLHKKVQTTPHHHHRKAAVVCAPQKCMCKSCVAKACKAKSEKHSTCVVKHHVHASPRTSAFDAPKRCKHACTRSRTPSPPKVMAVSKQCMASPVMEKSKYSSDSESSSSSSGHTLPPVCASCGVRHGLRRRRRRRRRRKSRLPHRELAEAAPPRRRSTSSSSSSSSSSSGYRGRLSVVPKVRPIGMSFARTLSPTVVDEQSICSQPISGSRRSGLQSPAVTIVPEAVAVVPDQAPPAATFAVASSRRSSTSSSSTSAGRPRLETVPAMPGVAIAPTPAAVPPAVATPLPPGTPAVAPFATPAVSPAVQQETTPAAVGVASAQPSPAVEQTVPVSPGADASRLDTAPPPQDSRPPFPPPGMQSFDESVMHGEVIPMSDDGSRGFSAISTVLMDSHDIGYHRDPRELRLMLAERLPAYWDDFFEHPRYKNVMSQLHRYEGLEQAMNSIRNPETWLGSTLGEFELIVLASEFDVIIRIVSRQVSPDHDAGGPPNYVSLSSSNWAGRVQAPVIAEIVPINVHMNPRVYHQLPVVYLLFEDNHYSAIVRESPS